MFQCLTRHKNTQAVQHSVGWSYYTKRFLSSAPCDSAVRVEVVQPPCPFPAIMNSSLGRWTERLICPEAVTDKQAYWWYARPHQGLRLFGARFTSNLLLKCLTRAWELADFFSSLTEKHQQARNYERSERSVWQTPSSVVQGCSWNVGGGWRWVSPSCLPCFFCRSVVLSDAVMTVGRGRGPTLIRLLFTCELKATGKQTLSIYSPKSTGEDFPSKLCHDCVGSPLLL